MSEAREKAKEEVDTYRAQMEAQVARNEQIQLAPMIEEIFTDLAPLAEKNGITLEAEGDGIGCWRWICKGSGGADEGDGPSD